MYIKHETTAAAGPGGMRALVHGEFTDGERVTFHPETGTAQVTNDIGEQLIEHYDAIVPADSDRDDSN
jgi:hypothetical protein